MTRNEHVLDALALRKSGQKREQAVAEASTPTRTSKANGQKQVLHKQWRVCLTDKDVVRGAELCVVLEVERRRRLLPALGSTACQVKQQRARTHTGELLCTVHRQ